MITAKSIKNWMKRLPENKWRKIYNVDARRVAYFVNNGVNSTLPENLSGKTRSDFNKEKQMAENYLNYLKELESRKNEGINGFIKLLPLIKNK